jgi:DNA topoisomerase-1
MRTDSYNVNEIIQKQALDFIEKNYGKDYRPKTPNIYTKKVKGAQEAHEAIHPTDVNLTPQSIKKYLTEDEYKLYDLIWKKFIASQMESAVFDQLSVEIVDETNKAVFKTGGRTLKFDGYLRVYQDEEDKKDDEDEKNILPPLKEGDEITLLDLNTNSHTTTPPPNYNEASLIKTLENHGIGRPSTYATIISTIIKRGYVKRDKGKKLVITELGRKVTEKLIEFFPDIMSLNYTATIEDKLDDIADANLYWLSLLKDFYEKFSAELNKAMVNMEKEKDGRYTAIKCLICGSNMILKESKYGKYLICSKYPKCRGKVNLDNNNSAKFQGIKIDRRCDKCSSGYMVLRKGPKNYFLGCSNFPKCRNVIQISQDDAEDIIKKNGSNTQ